LNENHLGVDGARAMQPGIRLHQTLLILALNGCRLGDDGISSIVDALVEGNNSTIKEVCLSNNGITSRGLPHMTRLLQHVPSATCIMFDSNPGMFDDVINSRLFFNTLRNTTVKDLSFKFCRLPGQAVVSLFQAAATNKKLQDLYVYDNEQLEGDDLTSLLEFIPKMENLLRLSINLDFTNPAVLSAFHLNTSIHYLFDENDEQIDDGRGPVADIGERNTRLFYASLLLDDDDDEPWGGVWANAMEQLTRDETGATAVYKIMQEQLVMWWTPTTTKPASTTTTNTAAAAVVTAAAVSTATSSSNAVVTVKRELTANDCPSVTNDNEEPKQKHPRLL
jgi:hypothetical protein